jgi:competence protein ComEA
MGHSVISIFQTMIKTPPVRWGAVSFILGVGLAFVLMGPKLQKSCILEGGDLDTSSSSPGTIVVELSGAVVYPGLYTMQENSRVGELLAIGGGITQESSAKWVSLNLNSAQVLLDSDKIYVPFAWELLSRSSLDLVPLVRAAVNSTPAFSGSSLVASSLAGDSSGGVSASVASDEGSVSSSRVPISVNTATSEELKGLSGIGEVYAKKIIENRPYSDIADLMDRTQISAKTLEKIRESITF